MANGLPREFGKYELVEMLGEGGMARVYRAVLSGPGGFRKQVAVKQMRTHVGRDERMVRLLINEARLGGHLHHPNLVEVYEFGQVDDIHYLAIEYVDGPTLSQVMDRAASLGPMPPRIAASIAMQICLGLQYAHTAVDDQGQPMKLVHRDLKPSNVLLRRDGVVKLADFGVARANTNVAKTTTGMTRGTPQFMSPEQVTGEKHGQLDGRSDLFSLASILAEMINGKPAFEDANLLDLLNKIARVEVEAALTLVAERAAPLQSVLRKGWQEWPQHRHVSALEMGRDIRRCYDRLPATPEERIGPWLAEWMGEEGGVAAAAVTEDSLLDDDSLSLPFDEVSEESQSAPEPTRESLPTRGDSLDGGSLESGSIEESRPWRDGGLASQDEPSANDALQGAVPQGTTPERPADEPAAPPSDPEPAGGDDSAGGEAAWSAFLSHDEGEASLETPRAVGKVGAPIFETAIAAPTLEEERPSAKEGDVGRTFTLVVIGAVTAGLLGLAAFVYRAPLSRLLGMESPDPTMEAAFHTPEATQPDAVEGDAPSGHRATTPVSAPAEPEPVDEVTPEAAPSQEEIGTLLSRRPRLRRCIRQHTKEHGALDPVTVTYTVAPNGKVSGAEVVSPGGLDPGFSSCLCEVVDHLKLEPTGSEEPLERRYTLQPPE